MRNQYFQQLRGLCIIFVVLIHLPIGLDSGDSLFLWLSVRQFINFPVATFIFLAAYYCKYDETISLATFYGKRLKRLLVPYVIWAFFYLVLQPMVSNRKIADDALFHFLTGYGPTYFLLALAQLTLLTPLIFKYKNKVWFRILSYLITPTYLLFYYVYLCRYGAEIPASQMPFPAFYIFYFIGVAYRDKLDKLAQKIGTLPLIFAIIISLVISNIEGLIILADTGVRSFAISQIKLSSVVYSLFMILLFIALKSEVKHNWLSHVGDYSMGIFMLHPFFNLVFKFIVIHSKVFDYNSFPGITINHLIVLICSIICSLATAYHMDKFFPKLSKTLGLK